MKSFIIKLDKETHAKVKFLAFKEGDTMSNFIKVAIDNHIRLTEE